MALALLTVGVPRAQADPPSDRPEYPPARRSADADRWHDHEVPDPYRWLERGNLPETRSWLAAQADLTTHYLQSLPGRDAIRRRLVELWDYEKCSVPQVAGGRYYFQRQQGLTNQAVLCVADARDGEPRPVVDPNLLDAAGRAALCGWTVSPDGRWLAYGIAWAGSDEHQWRIRDLRSGRDLPEILPTALFAELTWSPASDGFYYCRGDSPGGVVIQPSEPHFRYRVLFHRPGEPASRDRMLYETYGTRDLALDARLTADGRWLVVRQWHGLERDRRVFALPTDRPSAAPHWLVPRANADYQFVGCMGDEFLFQTDFEAPRGRVIALHREHAEPANWRTVVPESDRTLVETIQVGSRLVLRRLADAITELEFRDQDGQVQGTIPLPGPGTVVGLRRGPADRSVAFTFTSYTSPPVVWECDLESGACRPFRPPRLPFAPADFETQLVHFAARDGTRIPLMLARRRERVAQAGLPTLLYGYGGFHVPMTPAFSITHLAWLEMGGILAVPNIRGGGEFGRPWHAAGQGPNKKQAVDDFVAAAQWLVDEGLSSPDRLAMRGISNGGLVVGAALAQRPDLFAAAVPSVGVFDMLRYHRLPGGWAWAAEYGTADDPQQFQSLLSYSPLHNLRPGIRYPATLVMTGDRDERVVPAHSFKFTAALQAAQAASAPCLLRVESQAGHGAGTPTAKLIDASADTLAFLCHVLKVAR